MLTDPPAPQTLEEATALLRLAWEQLGQLQGAYEQLQAAYRVLQARVDELEARLGQNSTNSSRPPSSDPPSVPPRPPAPPTGRRRGAQPGHPAHQRTLLPPDQVDEVIRHWPRRCRQCQGLLVPGDAPVVGEPVRHQVTELPPIRAVVTEHRREHLRCPRCGQTTCAPLPPDVPAGAFGPRLQATVAVLSGRYRLSRREVVGVCTDVLGAPLAVGSVDGLCQATAAALAEPVAELQVVVQQAPAVHADETSWRQAGQRCWLWVVVAAVATVFTIAPSRGRVVIQGLLGTAFAGILSTDRWSAYTWVPADRRQVCWAHLKRDFQALVDAGGAARPIGEAALALLERLFEAWHAGRDEPAPRPRLAAGLAPLQEEFHTLLEQGHQAGHYKASGLCGSLLKLEPALWTFVTMAGVEPTNNAAEQALRPAVLWRKGSFGTQSPGGSIFVTRLLSVAATCKQQQRSLLEYLTAVCTAAQRGQPIPSLLTTTPLAQAA